MAQTFQTGFRTTLAKKLNVADTTIELATAPTVTKGRMHIYKGSTHAWIKYTGVTGTTLTGVSFVSQTADPATTVTGTPFPAGTAIELVEMHDQMLDKQEGGTITGDIQLDGDVTNTLSFRVPVYADATARDAGIPSPSNGMLIYNTALGVLQQYIAGSWQDNATGTTSNASTTVAGKVEIATQAEFDAGTDTGGTGAPVVPLPSYFLGTNAPIFTLPAGENLTANEAVYEERQYVYGFIANQTSADNNMGNASANTRVAVRIIGNGVSASSLKLSLKKTGSPADNVTVRIETDNAGAPSGTLADANATATVAGSGLGTSYADTTVTFAGAFTLINNTVYHIVIARSAGNDAVNNYQIQGIVTTARAFQTALYNTSWGSYGGTNMIYVSYTGMYSSLFVKSNATNLVNSLFDGFAQSSVSRGASVNVLTRGIGKNFSGLTYGSQYYLSNTDGAISTTAGTNLVPVGIAKSTTTLDIRNFPKASHDFTEATASSSNSTIVTSAVFINKHKLYYCNLTVQGSTVGSGTAKVQISDDGFTFTDLVGITSPYNAAEALTFCGMLPGNYYRAWAQGGLTASGQCYIA